LKRDHTSTIIKKFLIGDDEKIVRSLQIGYWVLIRLTTTSKYGGDHKFSDLEH